MFNTTPEEAKKNFTTLSYNGKRVVADIYGRATVTLVAEIRGDQISLSGFFTANGRETPTDKVDCLFEGPPVGFVKGISLHFAETFFTYRLIKSLPKTIDMKKLRALQKDGEVIILGEIPKEKPHLDWIDPYGVTVRLKTGLYEKELIEAGYRKLPDGTYYCSRDKVYSALELLTCGGWEIFLSGKQVIPLSDFSFKEEEKVDGIFIEGSLDFYGEKVDLADCLNKSRVILETKIALLPDSFKLSPLLKKGVKEGKKVKIPAHAMGLIRDVFSCPFTPPPSSFKGILRDYQQKGFEWLQTLYNKGFSGLLADEMGLGKTVQALAFLADKPGGLIVAPSSLLFNWADEIRTFVPDFPFTLYQGKDRKKESLENPFVITSYALIRQDLPYFQNRHWNCLIVDEAQTIKNRETSIFQALNSLKTDFRLSVTGTPIENKWEEIKNHFTFLMPKLIDSGDEPSLVKQKIAPFILRRTKTEVVKDLPEKVYETVVVEMTDQQKELYETFLKEAQATLPSMTNQIEILELILRLRQIACHPRLAHKDLDDSGKLNQLLIDLETLMDEKQSVIIFSQFTSFLKIIKSNLKQEPLYLDGSTTNREEIVKSFQQGDNPLLLMSLKAGGVGLNLTRADTIIIMDPWWNEAVEEQAIGRSHRIGRLSPVFARRYISRGTIEEKIFELKRSKSQLFEQLFHEKGSDIKELLLPTHHL